MTLPEAAVSLGGWQACLAIAPSRLGNPDHELRLAATCDDEAMGRIAVEGRLAGFAVEILRTGLEFVRLRFAVQAALTIGTRRVDLQGAGLCVTVPFAARPRGDGFVDVVPVWDDRDRSVDVDAEGLGLYDRAALLVAWQEWVAANASRLPPRLLSFRAAAGGGAGVALRDIRFTTTRPDASPGPPALLLLMRETPQPPRHGDAVIDPHVLPQGQTAVLWVGPELLRRSGGDAALAEADAALAALARPMDAPLPRIGDALRRWAATIAAEVSLPGGLVFTSVQQWPAGLLLSATPLSLDEIDALTPDDPTVAPQGLVQQEADALWRRCLLHHMDDGWREHLLGEPKPALPRELATLTTPRHDFHARLAMLRLGRTIVDADLGRQPPFTALDRGALDAALREAMRSEAFAEQAEGLHTLAFCVARPRLALYVEDAPRWRDAWAARLQSAAYLDALAVHADPVRKLHDDHAKLSLLDPGGTLARELLPRTVAALLQRLATTRWAAFVVEREADLMQALVPLLAVHGPKPPDADELLAVLRADAKAHGAGATLDAAARRFAKAVLKDEAEGPRLAALVSTAVLALVLADFRRHLDPALGDAAVAESARRIAAGFAAVLGSARDLAAAVHVHASAWVVRAAKAFNWLSRNVVSWAAGHALPWLKSAAKALASGAQAVSRLCGAALCAVSAVLAVWDAAADLQAGDVGAAVIDFIQVSLSVAGMLLVVLPVSGPWSLALMAAGALLGLLRLGAFKRQSAAEKAAERLLAALRAEGLAAA